MAAEVAGRWRHLWLAVLCRQWFVYAATRGAKINRCDFDLCCKRLLLSCRGLLLLARRAAFAMPMPLAACQVSAWEPPAKLG